MRLSYVISLTFSQHQTMKLLWGFLGLLCIFGVKQWVRTTWFKHAHPYIYMCVNTFFHLFRAQRLVISFAGLCFLQVRRSEQLLASSTTLLQISAIYLLFASFVGRKAFVFTCLVWFYMEFCAFHSPCCSSLSLVMLCPGGDRGFNCTQYSMCKQTKMMQCSKFSFFLKHFQKLLNGLGWKGP